MTDLDKLIAAVEAGTATDDAIGSVFSPNDIPSWHLNQLARNAFDGSLDAALRLHEALLPGWVARHTWGGPLVKLPTAAPIPYTHVFRPRMSEEDDPLGESSSGYRGDNPARAWLLAILRAMWMIAYLEIAADRLPGLQHDLAAWRELAPDRDEFVARAALAQTLTDPGDGWTWNERLGWIGPDGKPADPRRRG